MAATGRAKWGKAKEKREEAHGKKRGLRIETRLGLNCGWQELLWQVELAAMASPGDLGPSEHPQHPHQLSAL